MAPPDNLRTSRTHNHSDAYTKHRSHGRPLPFVSVPPSPSSSSASYADSSRTTSTSWSAFSRNQQRQQQQDLDDARATFLLSDDPPEPARERDSFISIVDDPFFHRYHLSPSDAHGAAGEPSPPESETELDPEPGPSRPRDDDPASTSRVQYPPRRESLTTNTRAAWQHTSSMDTINIAVIGSDGVGKSSFIQRSMRLSRPPAATISSVKMDVENIPHVVTLIELDMEYFDVNPNQPTQPIQWPKQINGHIIPRVDAALILYDVMNKSSIKELPQTLAAISNSALPTILVATKCDTPENIRQIDVAAMSAAFTSAIGSFQTTANVPESTRNCLAAMLRAVMANRRGELHKSDTTATRPRAASSATHLDAAVDSSSRPISEQSNKHSRASSDFSLVRGITGPGGEGYVRGAPSRSPREGSSPQILSPSFGSEPVDENPSNSVTSMLRATGVRLDTTGHDSCLDTEASDGESPQYADEIPILQRNDEIIFEKPSKVAGVTFDELIDRLLAPRMSRSDNNFANVFLCLYRKFASPSELFDAIATRLDQVQEDKTAHYLAKSADSMRVIEVVAKWVSRYPGDFARRGTRTRLDDLIKQLSTEPVFAAAAHQMAVHLEYNVTDDDDTGWAKSDEVDEPTTPDEKESAKKGSNISDSMSSLTVSDPKAAVERRASTAGSDLSNPEHARDSSSQSVHFQYHSFEDYEREAALMVPMPIHPLTKFRYHIFMGTETEEIADEITRIDWVMFSSIRIRDLVRHVSLSVDQKQRCRSLENVNRMISHFNHVARWVANMILIRDKPKHRAPCLEKFMNVAHRLRTLNNYNGLAAVLAGINGTAIHRLAQTRALVNPETQKRFARLVLLMGTQKSHFAYRLAWENSPLPRIPFMPLHRRDLVSAEEGSRTFVGPHGDRINWRKFEVLGEVLLPIMRSQGTPYPNLRRHDMSRELILDCRIPVDDEETYQRSIQLEPTSNAPDGGKKKFPWLAK